MWTNTKNVKIAMDAFELEQDIDGELSGGIDPVKILLGVQVVNDKTIEVKYTYPETCGLSDVRYHVANAGKELSKMYEFKNNRIYIDGKDDLFVFAMEFDDSYKEKVKGFYNKWNLKNVIM